MCISVLSDLEVFVFSHVQEYSMNMVTLDSRLYCGRVSPYLGREGVRVRWISGLVRIIRNTLLSL